MLFSAPKNAFFDKMGAFFDKNVLFFPWKGAFSKCFFFTKVHYGPCQEQIQFRMSTGVTSRGSENGRIFGSPGGTEGPLFSLISKR